LHEFLCSQIETSYISVTDKKYGNAEKSKVHPHFVIILLWGGTESAVCAPLSQKWILDLAYSGQEDQLYLRAVDRQQHVKITEVISQASLGRLSFMES
jgi:hypothetical protein